MAISALIITRGDSPHLRATLGSIRAQLLTPDEVVVVTEKEVQEHEQLLERVLGDVVPRLSVIEGEGRGAAHAWNLGIANCGSDYVAIIDDDDLWLPNHLSLCDSAADITDSDIVLTGFYSLGGSVFREDMLPPTTLVPTDFMGFNPGMRGSNIFARRSIIEGCGGFDETLATSSDRGLGIRISRIEGLRFTPLLTRTVLYRSHSGPRMVDPSPERLNSFNQLLHRHRDDLTEEQVAYAKGRITQFWGFSVDDLNGAECDESLVYGWNDFLIGESRPEDYPMAFQKVLNNDSTQMTPFLCDEYHRRMELYDVMYPCSHSFRGSPKHIELVAPNLETAAHPVARSWVREQQRGFIVDYGCGGGGVLTSLIPEGYNIVLYDPDDDLNSHHVELVNKWSKNGSNRVVLVPPTSSVSSTIQGAPVSGGISGVVCSMVVCQLQNDAELANLLIEIHSTLPKGGRALISWCSPGLWDVNRTHVHEVIHRSRNGTSYYEKECSPSGKMRPEYVWTTQQLLAVAPEGLELVDDWFVWGWDVDENCATPWIQFCEMRRVV
jgi:glycosyltransferase involved in cell wall biosynthesis/SAM-dependent methyltransferase